MNQSNNAKEDLSDLFGPVNQNQAPQDTKSAQLDKFQKVEPLVGEVQEDSFPSSTFTDLMRAAGGPFSQRFQTLFRTFWNTKDPEERTDTRNRLIPAFWELAELLAPHCRERVDSYIRNFFRFGVVDPSLIDKAPQDLLSSLFVRASLPEPIFYLDEWLYEIASGNMSPTDTGDLEAKQTTSAQRDSMKLNKMENHIGIRLQAMDFHNNEIDVLENLLTTTVQYLQQRESDPSLENKRPPYNATQKKKLSEISSIARNLSLVNRKLEVSVNDYLQAKKQLEKLQLKAGDHQLHDSSFDSTVATTEMRTVRSMIKLCVGRSGNQFPILTSSYFSGDSLNTGFRERVINTLAEIEHLDGNVFMRSYREITTRITPNILLAPCYGDFGICWIPFEKFSRSTSRGRIVIPMYPRSLKIAISAAIGDLRWQTAKEKASRFWMEEGLTGWYYDYFTGSGLKGDIKQHFIRDYILWIQKESEGTQKLAKDVRSIFWRYIPFPQEVKEYLKNRGYVYQELYKKDQNRSISSMY